MTTNLCISDTTNDTLHIIQVVTMNLGSSTPVASQPNTVGVITGKQVTASSHGANYMDIVKSRMGVFRP